MRVSLSIGLLVLFTVTAACSAISDFEGYEFGKAGTSGSDRDGAAGSDKDASGNESGGSGGGTGGAKAGTGGNGSSGQGGDSGPAGTGGDDAGADGGTTQPPGEFGDSCDDEHECREGLFCNAFNHCVDDVICSDGDSDGDGVCDGDDVCDNFDDTVNTDDDAEPDGCDDDDDNDGVDDEDDPEATDPSICGDSDDDTCDDCSEGTDGLGPESDANPDDDGTDTDSDGLCDKGDDDDDNDGIDDEDDPEATDPDICGDSDEDACDDCAVGTDDFGPESDANPDDDGTDTDSDGLCDESDHDFDNDGVDAEDDPDDSDPDVCGDRDRDSCEDCSVGTDDFGPEVDSMPENDGPDADGDGICDPGDNCLEVANPGQVNDDSDVYGNACDNCPFLDNPGQDDFDHDGVGDDCDNCPVHGNPGQADSDENGTGDICDGCGFQTDWCGQIGTRDQHTRCREVRDDGFTCRYPMIRYGHVIGGVPRYHPNNDYDAWCKQLGFGDFTGQILYTGRYCDAPLGGLHSGTSADDPGVWHWLDYSDSYWRAYEGEQQLDYHSCGNQISRLEIKSITCGNCDDRVLTPGEEIDPLPSPFSTAPATSGCRFNFSGIDQLYCNSSCSKVGASGCDQADADVLCKLKMDNPRSVATSFTITAGMVDKPGFACANGSYGTRLPSMASRGVFYDVYYYDAFPDSHNGSTVMDVACTNPLHGCGDAVLQDDEEVDPPPGPFSSAPINTYSCRFDFRAVNQLYCDADCSYGGGPGCDQADADILCKLKTDDPLSRAEEYEVGEAAANVPGFTCPDASFGTLLPNMASRGIDVDVFYSDLTPNAHEGGEAIIGVICTQP